jgi:hypothetical protein
MEKADQRAKDSYIKDMDRLMKKYQQKTMTSPGNSWRFRASIDVRQKILEIKYHLATLKVSE